MSSAVDGNALRHVANLEGLGRIFWDPESSDQDTMRAGTLLVENAGENTVVWGGNSPAYYLEAFARKHGVANLSRDDEGWRLRLRAQQSNRLTDDDNRTGLSYNRSATGSYEVRVHPKGAFVEIYDDMDRGSAVWDP